MNPSICSYIRHFYAPLLMVTLLSTCIVGGCARKPDQRLADIDAIMESHPDSALSRLNAYRLSPESSSADSAYYGLLLTHARYKNFIDETSDSLISRSVDYFVDRGDKDGAARSLFLQGMIQYNAGRLGEAAVSFSKGLDLAQESKSYMWEGQCARGLSLVYEDLHDGSAQVNFAERSLSAFKQTDDNGWIDYSRYLLALAYNNNGAYHQTISLIDELNEEGCFSGDSIMLSNLHRLKGMSLFALGRYTESLAAYSKAHNLNSSEWSAAHIGNIQEAIYELRKNGVLYNSYPDLGQLRTRDASMAPFAMYAREGRYKEAFESIEAYKNLQDSILSVIIRNNVADSVNKYKAAEAVRINGEVQKERMVLYVVMLMVISVGILFIWLIREKMLREMASRLKAEADLESLRSDFNAQIEVAYDGSKGNSNSSEPETLSDFESIIRQHYAEVNRLCDDYYQEAQLQKKKGEEISVYMKGIIESFTDKESLNRISAYVNEKSGGLYTSFKNDFFQLPGDSHRLFLYLCLGLSPRTLSVLMGNSLSAVYTKKSRLKGKVEQSNVTRKEEYLKFF